ncbi:MAG TPA: SHOCT domain-containing protein [Candidatus Paceibacterota bacterium]|nr:SHOCT domain-containing protein [Candidatus Paceibacterota bacterium]
MYLYYPTFGFFNVLNTVFWIIFVIFIIKLIKRGSRPWNNVWSDRSMDILRERYAKGEISKEEFEARKKDLQG